jgi:L-threonylcarbamoyladenylate synthase
MITRRLKASDPDVITLALEALRTGGLVAFPTDTVYGVAGLVQNPEAIGRLFLAKKRPESKSIPILLPGAKAMGQVAIEVPDMARRLASVFWPGPLTLIVRRHPALPPQIGLGDTIGMRVPDHPVALRLLHAVGPLATTSANRSGQSDCLTAEEVLEQLGGVIELLIDGGPTPGGRPSTVVDCTGAQPQVLRAGPVSLAQIEACLSRHAPGS